MPHIPAMASKTASNEYQVAFAAFHLTLALLKVFLSDPLGFEDLGRRSVDRKSKIYGDMVGKP